MIIKDIITELEKTESGALIKALQGLRAVYSILPAELQKDLLGDYSNTEYAILSAGRNTDCPAIANNKEKSIYDIYLANKS